MFKRNLPKAINLIVVFIIINTFQLKAQNNPYNEVNIASPTAASLGKYADIPVNVHTGIPSISIPIYTINEGPLTLPISLSYHAGGLKVLETSSWVGAGWSMNAGGVITRSVQGAPDERQTSSVYDQTHGYLSDSGYNKYIWIPGNPVWNQTPPRAPWPWINDWKKFAEGKKDGEPDLFFFNFAGYSGKFFIRDDGKPIVVPDQDIKIEYVYVSGYSISSFTLTTPDGIKYSFGKTVALNDVDPVEKTNPMSTQGGLSQGNVISSWYLNKISSADNMFAITLTYQPENYGFYTISMFPVKFDASSGTDYSLIKNIVNGVRLSQIVFSNGKVDFNANTVRQDLNGSITSFIDDMNAESKALDNISIYDPTQLMGKKFIFSYNYFIDNITPLPGWFSNYGFTIDKKRLKLLSVQEQSLDGSISIPPHQFEYFAENIVPRRLCFGIDHWGFYNGVQNNVDLIPTYTINDTLVISGADRDAHWPAMGAGALKKITYPTKGFSEFTYENNSAWVSYTNKQWNSQFGLSAGYDGNSSWVNTTRFFTGNTYKIGFSNSSSVGSQAFLEIYRVSDNYQMDAWVLEPQKSIIIYINYPAGNYRVQIKKTTQGFTGNGTTASFDELGNVQVQKNDTVGGLRIQSLKYYDGIADGNSIIKVYNYNISGQSTGILYSRPSYVYKVRNDIIKDVGIINGDVCPMTGETGGCPVCGGSWFFKSGSGIRPMGTTQGNHIGYGEVKIAQTGNGYTVNRFYGSDRWETNKSDVALRKINTSPACPLTIENYPFAPVPFEYKRGELQYESYYSESGKLLKEYYFSYQYQNDPITTPGFIAVFRPDWEPSPSGDPFGSPSTIGTFYRIQTKKKTQAEVSEIDYSQYTGSIQNNSVTYYESSFHTQPTRRLSINSNGDTVESRYKYVFDFRISACDQITNSEAVYYNDTVNATSEYLLNLGNGQPPYRFWAWQYYMFDMSQARNKYVNSRRANYTGTNNASSVCLNNAKATADTWLKPIIEMQQLNINAPIESSVWKGGKFLSANFNKYDYAISPATAVYPSKTLAVNLSSPAASFSSAIVSGNSIIGDNRYEEETSAIFYNGNLVELTPKNGVKISYLWGYNNSLPIVKVIGKDYISLSSAYSSVSGDLSSLRNLPLLSGSLIQTYNYMPLYGITVETDPKRVSTYYEYDKLGRLKLIRDKDGKILKLLEYKYQQTVQ